MCLASARSSNLSWNSAMCVLAVVEADADVQIKVAVAHGRRAREFIFHLGDLQADAAALPLSTSSSSSGVSHKIVARERSFK